MEHPLLFFFFLRVQIQHHLEDEDISNDNDIVWGSHMHTIKAKRK